MEYLKLLNEQQQQAVMAGLGPVLVMAGPGSGKTRVLTYRIAYLIQKMGVSPHHILAVTFTNKAAREMETRVADILADKFSVDTHSQVQRPSLGTFHASCARILRREANNLPFNANFVIFDSDDQISVVKQAIRDIDLDEKLYRPNAVHGVISNAKNELFLPDDFPIQSYRDEVIARIYRRYQELLLASNALDFDDLLLWTAFVMENYPQVREYWGRRYEHVMVDEFQDTNLAQYELLKHLVHFHRNIYVVGDADQSIYGWRGADYRNVLRFEEDFPDAQKILLEHNYRSTQPILDVAMAVIDQNPARTPKRLFAERGSGTMAILHEAYDDRAEAVYVVDTIAGLVARQQVEPGGCAVMYRTNAQSRLLEEAFLRAGLPYKLVGAQRFYGRREVKDIIAYLRLIHNPSDSISLMRVINTPTRGIGNKTVIAIRTLAQQSGLGMVEMLEELRKGTESIFWNSLSSRMASVAGAFGHLLYRWRGLRHQLSTLELVDQILLDTEYQTYIDDGSEEGHDRWENILELRRLAAEHEQSGLEGFLEHIALVSDQDTLVGDLKVPTLMTLHAAKGLEFPTVFIVGLNDGTLPHSRSFDDPEAMQEERRLFYVGITRAMDRLYLVYAQSRSQFGYTEPVDPSRYIDDIPTGLIEGRYSSASRWAVKNRQNQVVQWKIDRVIEEPNITQHFHPGMRVLHPVWEEGMVLNSRLEDDEEIVDIFFEDVGLKRVAASLAKLEIIT